MAVVAPGVTEEEIAIVAAEIAERWGVPSSRVLGAALERAGFTRGPGEAAHHIVAGSAREAAVARGILRDLKIGINDAANGVFLPGSRLAENAAGAAVHSSVHTSAYYRAVNAALAGATTREEALIILGDIAARLRAGGLP